MRQYDIYWADLPAPIGRRPVLLLARSSAFGYLNKVIVVEITTTIRNIPQEVRLSSDEGLREPCVANMDNVHVVPLRRIGEQIGRVSSAREREIKRALGYALDWPELKIL